MDNPFRGNRVWHRDRPNPEELNRLGYLDIEIEDANGVNLYDPNSAIGEFLGRGKWKDLVPIDGLFSVCSGEPAVYYRTHEAEIALTPAEVFRLNARSLTPDEFFAICEAVGAIWEIHDDFHDAETGEALQPKDDFFTDGPPRPTKAPINQPGSASRGRLN